MGDHLQRLANRISENNVYTCIRTFNLSGSRPTESQSTTTANESQLLLWHLIFDYINRMNIQALGDQFMLIPAHTKLMDSHATICSCYLTFRGRWDGIPRIKHLRIRTHLLSYICSLSLSLSHTRSTTMLPSLTTNSTSQLFVKSKNEMIGPTWLKPVRKSSGRSFSTVPDLEVLLSIAKMLGWCWPVGQSRRTRRMKLWDGSFSHHCIAQ